MNYKRVALAALFLCGSLFAADNINNINDPSKLLDEGQNGVWSAKAITLNVDAKNHYSRGPENPKIDIVEFADFQCPYCRQAERNLEALAKAYPDEVRLTFVNLPLMQIHSFALGAAKAVLAAGLQGHFWEMHDILMQNSPNLAPEKLVSYAEKIGLDVEKFKSDISSEQFDVVLKSDLDEVKRLHVPGTPTFFVNRHQLLDGGLTVSSIEELLNKKGN